MSSARGVDDTVRAGGRRPVPMWALACAIPVIADGTDHLATLEEAFRIAAERCAGAHDDARRIDGEIRRLPAPAP